MRKTFRVSSVVLSFCLLASLFAFAQSRPDVLSSDEIKKIVPAAYFFRGQSAPVQLRNSCGFRAPGDKFVLAGLVDTSGYASDVREKYQGFLVTEVKLDVEGRELPPGQYGFGFSKEGKFVVMDVGANDLLEVAAHREEALPRAVPLKITSEKDGYRLYAGKNWVALKAQ